MAKPEILKHNSFPFMITVSWEHGDDENMVRRLYEAKNYMEPDSSTAGSNFIPWEKIETYYLIGERKIILIGRVETPLEIQRISSFFIFGSTIEIKMSYILAAVDLAEVDPVKVAAGI